MIIEMNRQDDIATTYWWYFNINIYKLKMLVSLRNLNDRIDQNPTEPKSF